MYLADQPTQMLAKTWKSAERAHCEIVCKRASWLDGTLGHTGDTVHIRSTILVETVEVQTRAFTAELVDNIDHNAVSHSRSDVRYRPLPVNSNHRSIEKAIRVSGDPCDVEIVRDSGCTGEPAEAEEETSGRREHDDVRNLRGD